MVWTITHASFGLPQPSSVTDMIGQCLMGVCNEFKSLILLEAAATCWSLWLYQNALIFENKQSSFLRIIFSISHWVYTWTILQWPIIEDLAEEA